MQYANLAINILVLLGAIIIDSKNDLRKDDFKAQGSEIQVLDLSKERLQNIWNPYKALRSWQKKIQKDLKVLLKS